MRSKNMTVLISIFGLLLAFGCTRQGGDVANVEDNVEKALRQADIEKVNVDVDQDKKIVRLTGDVQAEDTKLRAEEVARSAAPGFVVANEIGVRPEGVADKAEAVDENVDDAIESNYKAALLGNKLDDEGIRYDANNGVLTLKGDVPSMDVRQKAEQLASSVPNVRQVVNELQVKAGRRERKAEEATATR
jgi:hyperosmotically inducible protein